MIDELIATSLSELRPFAQGNAGEVETNMVRIYDCSGFPRIEVFMAHVGDDLDGLAEQIVSALNNGPDRTGP